jgi:carotenoid 1,2-hydratase
VFSPYYAWANRKQPAPAENFCAINCVLYQRKGGVWAMTERGARNLDRNAGRLRIGPSGLAWDGTQLIAQIEEVAAPLPRRLRGVIRVKPQAIQTRTFNLDESGRHRWRPIAPRARVEVEFGQPSVYWRGNAYFDSNEGDGPLADDFSAWSWSRTTGRDGTTILYDVERRRFGQLSLALNIDDQGNATEITAPPEQALPPTLWRMPRRTRADAGFSPQVIRTFEDAPFYTRSQIATRIHGVESEAIHESLSLNRFEQPWVQALLPFRMPRRR